MSFAIASDLTLAFGLDLGLTLGFTLTVALGLAVAARLDFGRGFDMDSPALSFCDFGGLPRFLLTAH